jgi:predicted membrane-bound mannosyltransferase
VTIVDPHSVISVSSFKNICSTFSGVLFGIPATVTATTTETNNTAQAAVSAVVNKSQDQVLERNQNTVVQQQAISDIQRSATSKEASKGITELKDVTDEHLKVAQSMDKTLSSLLEEVRGLRRERSEGVGKEANSSAKPSSAKKPATKRKELPVEMGFRR